MGVKVREKPKGSGIYWLFIHYHGKRTSKKVGDRKAAHALAHKLQIKLAESSFQLSPEKKIPKFSEYAQQWLETYIKRARRESTYERYSGVLKRYVLPTLGNMSLNEIKRAHVRDLMLQLHGKGYSRSIICLSRDVISGCLGYALDEELITVNPVSGVLKRLKLERTSKAAIEPLTAEEVELFLKTCLECCPEHYAFFFCAFRTGMRLGELLALRWGDVDWNSKFIRVERSYKTGRIEKTKTGKTRRVDMSDQLYEVLKAHLTNQKREALKSGKNEVPEIIFHKDGTHIEQNAIRKVFKKILRKAGIREIRFHDIRHTFASLLLSNSESPVYVKEQLG